MEIIKYFHRVCSIDDLIIRHPKFINFKTSHIRKDPIFEWENLTNGKRSWQALISFFGKSGYGKSSTINAFFGESILKTSDVGSCTSRCDCLDFKITDDYLISFADFPGIGESEYKDQEYLEMYKNFLSRSQVVVYLLRADMRDYSIDEKAYQAVFPKEKDKQKIVFAVNCCDKIEPINRKNFSRPSEEQLMNIEKKIESIKKIFKPYNRIIPYSAATSWNLDVLAESIVSVSGRCGDISFYGK